MKGLQEIYQLAGPLIDINKDKSSIYCWVGTDVVLDHLHKLESEGEIKMKRKGKKYIWNIK